MKSIFIAALGLGLALSAWAGTDDFQREGKQRELKDRLEGVAPPPLQVQGWINTSGQTPTWESLKGKVVLIDFWGTW